MIDKLSAQESKLFNLGDIIEEILVSELELPYRIHADEENSEHEKLVGDIKCSVTLDGETIEKTFEYTTHNTITYYCYPFEYEYTFDSMGETFTILMPTKFMLIDPDPAAEFDRITEKQDNPLWQIVRSFDDECIGNNILHGPVIDFVADDRMPTKAQPEDVYDLIASTISMLYFNYCVLMSRKDKSGDA